MTAKVRIAEGRNKSLRSCDVSLFDIDREVDTVFLIVIRDPFKTQTTASVRIKLLRAKLDVCVALAVASIRKA